MVRKSTPAERMSSITCITSFLVLAQPDHEARLGEHRRIALLHPLQQAQRVEVARAGPHLEIEPRHRLEVVVEDVRLGRHHHLRRPARTSGSPAPASRSSSSDSSAAPPGPSARNAPRRRPSRSSRSTEVITTCFRPIFSTASATRAGSGVERVRPAGGDVAEGAGPGADLAHDHHGGVALRPALADVRAARLLADRHQAVLAHDVAGALVALRARRLHPKPVRLAQHRRIRPVRLLRVALFAVFDVARGHGILFWQRRNIVCGKGKVRGKSSAEDRRGPARTGRIAECDNS